MCVWQLAGKVEPKEIQPGVGVAMVSGLLVANDNQYTLQVIHACFLLLVLVLITVYITCCSPFISVIFTHTHVHIRLTALCPGLPRWASTGKVKPIWILLEQETMSGSGISWAICKSASRSRQITTPASHYSSFFTGRMPFLPPNQQCQSTEGRLALLKLLLLKLWVWWCGMYLKDTLCVISGVCEWPTPRKSFVLTSCTQCSKVCIRCTQCARLCQSIKTGRVTCVWHSVHFVICFTVWCRYVTIDLYASSALSWVTHL